MVSVGEVWIVLGASDEGQEVCRCAFADFEHFGHEGRYFLLNDGGYRREGVVGR